MHRQLKQWQTDFWEQCWATPRIFVILAACALGPVRLMMASEILINFNQYNKFNFTTYNTIYPNNISNSLCNSIISHGIWPSTNNVGNFNETVPSRYGTSVWTNKVWHHIRQLKSHFESFVLICSVVVKGCERVKMYEIVQSKALWYSATIEIQLFIFPS